MPLVIGLLLVIGSVFPGSGHSAEVRYVKPTAEIPVRRGQGNEFKIIAMVKDGSTVELVQVTEDYAKVLLPNGKEGWMLKRFLSNEPPMDKLVEQLKEQAAQAVSQEEQARSDAEQLGKRLIGVEEELRNTIIQRDQLDDSYSRLEADTADVVKIKEDMARVSEENRELKSALTSVAEENDKLKKNAAVNWFLAGAGVLLVGMFLGKITSKSRKRKPSLL